MTYRKHIGKVTAAHTYDGVTVTLRKAFCPIVYTHKIRNTYLTYVYIYLLAIAKHSVQKSILQL